MKGFIIFVVVAFIIMAIGDDRRWTEEDEGWSCPFCDSPNTDGNHCDDCGEDY